MGRVWAGRRLSGAPGSANQLVAIKTGLGDGGGSAEFTRLFLDEARIASLIDHANVLAVHELGDQNGVLYLVMEWCDGATLRDVLDAVADHRIPLEVAVRIVADVAAGLHAAHELVGEDGEPMQVVHRDVSPQNVLLWSAGHVKVSDFGVAKARGQLHRPTETGEVKGKLSYMAPEQVTSPRIDRRADVFGLGCVLYEATVGQRPYHGGDALTTLYQLLERDTVTPRSIRPDYPEDLEAMVLRALSKTPDQRYTTADGFRQALEEWLHSRRAIITETQIAAVVLDAVGETIANRRASIADAIANLDTDLPVFSSHPPEPGVDTNEPTVRPLDPRSGARPTRRGSVGAGADRWRMDRWAVYGLTVGALVLATVVVLVAVRRPQPGSDVPSSTQMTAASERSIPATASTAGPSPPAPRQALITIRTSPPGARLQLDGETRSENPLVLRVPLDGSSHVIVASKAGYHAATQRVVYDGEKDVEVPLTRMVSTGPATRNPAISPSVGRPAPSTGGMVRPIDTSNPFERKPPP